jgi:opacity protein-like surface antigen
MNRLLTLAAAAVALAACATSSAPPPYAAAASATAAGYSETQIESNRYFVTYRAPRGADAAVLQDYALLRAADLTLQNGGEWFWVDRRTTDEETARSGGSSVGIGVGGGSYGRRSGASVGVGLNFPLGGGQSGPQARSATLEMRIGEGPKPDDPNAFDARSIATNLRSRIAG